MTTDLIRYDLLVQDALRTVVRDVLSEAAKNGLQGDHHFFITFRTTAPGLRLSNRMRARYPEEMTIILQHQFWDLGVTEHAFEVGLSFSNIPERLLVPFAAITSFVDPSVQFGLKFETQDDKAPAGEPAPETVAKPPEPLKALPGKRGGLMAIAASGPQAKTGKEAKDTAAQGPLADGRPAPPKGVTKQIEAVSAAGGTTEPEKAPANTPDGTDPKKVISIDAFRKKP